MGQMSVHRFARTSVGGRARGYVTLTCFWCYPTRKIIILGGDTPKIILRMAMFADKFTNIGRDRDGLFLLLCGKAPRRGFGGGASAYHTCMRTNVSRTNVSIGHRMIAEG